MDEPLDPDDPGPSARLLPLLPLVAVGGALGSLGRFGLVALLPDLVTTLAINVVGSFCLGVLVVRHPVESRWRPFLGTGVLGGFTTFSALAVQTVDASVLTGAGYLAITLAAGVGAAAAGQRAAA